MKPLSGKVALATDAQVAEKSGRAWATWTLAKAYGFRDADGRQPDWGAYMRKHFPELI